MKKKAMLALLLALVMALGATTALAADAFTDVEKDAYYADAVDWAVEKEITKGKGGGSFAPNDTVTRAEAVTFLWRLAGQPEPTRAETFRDVESDAQNSWYKTAVQWAVEKGITNGTGGGNFSPRVTCERGMILTMLYRMEGSPFDAAMAATLPEESGDYTLEDLGNALIQSMVGAMLSEDGLSDVKEGDYYELPVAWAMLNNILSENQVDKEKMAVQPKIPCPRGEMVYYLHGAAKYEEALAEAEEASKPPEPIETGTLPETAALDKNGVKVTVKGIEYHASANEVWLKLSAENKSGKLLAIDTGELFVNTYPVSPSTFIATEQEDGSISYEDVVVPAGESRDFCVGLNYLRDMGIAAVYEVELQMNAYTRTETEDGYEQNEFALGEPVKLQTSLYSEDVSYDQEGTVIYDRDGLKLLVTRAENHRYMGPQIFVYASNTGKSEVYLELSGLKLDGRETEASVSLTVPAGKRCADKVSIDLESDEITVKEAELTFQMLDPETWEPAETLDPVKVTFTK